VTAVRPKDSVALDDAEIRNLIARIAHLADTGDARQYGRCFTSDARWNMPGAPRRGRADIIAGSHERRDAGEIGPGSATRHIVGTIAVDVHGDFDLVARSGEVFVDRIVENFKNHVMQATLIRVADVHPRALANGLEAFQFVDLRSVVFLCRSDSGHLLVGQFLNRNLFLSLNHI